jgi:CP family cyanate transporter-like MFS transporter
MLIGEILPVAIMGPFLIGGLGGWQSALAFWSIPVVATAAAIWLLSENEPVEADHAPAKWWPNWRDSRVWLLGLTLGGASAAYWAANAFIPELLKHEHHGAYITAALTALNVAQLPASFIVAAWPQRLVARRWPLIAAGILIVLAAAGILAFPPVWSVVAAGCLGLASAWIFVLTLALPPMLAEAGDTHRVSAAMFTISYTCPFLGGVIGGALWDATGISQTAFVALFAGGLLVALAPIRFNLSETRLALHSSPVVPIAPTP